MVKVFPRPDPTVVCLRFEPETFLKFFGMFLRGLGIYPPSQIENLRVGILTGEVYRDLRQHQYYTL